MNLTFGDPDSDAGEAKTSSGSGLSCDLGTAGNPDASKGAAKGSQLTLIAPAGLGQGSYLVLVVSAGAAQCAQLPTLETRDRE